MTSLILKRSVVVNGHKTSVSLEEAFWSDFKDIAQAQRATLSELIGEIDQTREHANLSSAIRLFVLGHFLNKHQRIEAADVHHAGVNGERAQALQP
ncbi:MAG TPA: ribbon-helix-helix domain-containing protein [Pseudolabrys sp.]|jgi:predicted DNA-binding ribbon-helix-helix protein|nr:ribbon-helix-helix domain-containing protein [Pseudolabrys sp.]